MTDIPFNLTREGEPAANKPERTKVIINRGGRLVYEGKLYVAGDYEINRSFTFKVYKSYDEDLYYATCIMREDTNFIITVMDTHLDTAVATMRGLISAEYEEFQKRNQDDNVKQSPIKTHILTQPTTGPVTSMIIGGNKTYITNKSNTNEMEKSTVTTKKNPNKSKYDKYIAEDYIGFPEKTFDEYDA